MSRPTTPDGYPITEDTIHAEAAAIREISRLIGKEYDTVNMAPDVARDMLSALYGLDLLISAHARTTEQFALIVD